jgi:hypothetical protein
LFSVHFSFVFPLFFVLCSLLFVGCPTGGGGSSGGGGGGGGAGGGSSAGNGGFLGAGTVTINDTGVTTAADINFTHTQGGDYALSDILKDGWEAKLTAADGKFTLKLTEPKTLHELPLIDGLTATEGLLINAVSEFMNGDTTSWTKRIMWQKDANTSVSLYYANKDGTIKGTDSYGATFNMSLKKGWNTVIVSSSGGKYTYTSGKPDASYKWVVIDK